jgi:ABC-type polysaccharide/polyol phosphate export permease
MQDNRREQAISDLKGIYRRSYVWRALAFADIRSKYRFSTLGSFWLTISTAVTALAIGAIYGQFFGQDISSYLPYFVTGMVVWTFISSVVNEATTTLIGASNYIKASSFPIVNHVMRMLHRHFIIFLHNLIVVVGVYAYFRWKIDLGALMSLAGFVIVYLFLIGLSIVIAMISVRYRDIPPMIGAAIQFVFFATPILWYPEQIKVGAQIVHFNPVAHMIFIVRDPLVGRSVAIESWLFAGFCAVATLVFAAWAYTRFRGRIAFWV